MPAARATPAVALALCLAAASCARDASSDAPSDAGGSIRVEDSDGHVVDRDGPARRIVSLVPSATLTLAALGARETLVARTDFDSASWARALPSVGGGLQPRLEAIVAVHPDLVIRFGGSQDPQTPASLDEVGIPHVAIRPDRIEDVLATIRLLGTLVGVEARADSLATALRDELEAVRSASVGREPLRVAYVLGGSPPWVAGPETYIDELIRLAGGVNAFDDLGSLYAAVSPEQFLARDIDLVLTPDGGRLEPRLVGEALVVSTSDALELPGPAMGAAAREVAAALARAAAR